MQCHVDEKRILESKRLRPADGELKDLGEPEYGVLHRKRGPGSPARRWRPEIRLISPIIPETRQRNELTALGCAPTLDVVVPVQHLLNVVCRTERVYA